VVSPNLLDREIEEGLKLVEVRVEAGSINRWVYMSLEKPLGVLGDQVPAAS
jgi:hypothetical protein